MAGLSSKALSLGINLSKSKYNGNEIQSNEFLDGSGLELTDYGWRKYDQQIGRWISQDPLSILIPVLSPYRYGYNDPIRYRDIFGLIENECTPRQTGYIYDPKRKMIYFDESVHKQDDLDPNSGLEYLGENISVTRDGITTWYDENGNVSNSNPNWGNLKEVTVVGKKEKRNVDWWSITNTISYAGGAQSIYENVIFSNRRFEYKPSKGSNSGKWTSIWKTTKTGEFLTDINSLEDGYLVLKESKNAVSKFAKGNALTKFGQVLGTAGVLATIYDGATSEKGWQNHHTADLIIGVAMTFGPVGWLGGLTYLAVDIVTQQVTGKSITENLFDN